MKAYRNILAVLLAIVISFSFPCISFALDDTAVQEIEVKTVEERAEEILSSMTLEEKVAQMFMVYMPSEKATAIQKKYQFGGYLLFANNFSSPSVGRAAAALVDPSAREYGLDGSFTVDSSMFTTYREIQFSIIQEITSFTLQYAFRIPETAAIAAATTIAASTHTYHGILNPSAKYRHAPAPATYCPAAPMLNRPTL